MAQNKTEKATPRRRDKIRKEGKIPRSRDLSSSLMLIAVVMFLEWSPLGWVEQWHDLMKRLLAEATSSDFQSSSAMISWTGITFFKWAAPTCLLTLVVALAVQLAQGGFVFSGAAVTLNPGKMNPAQNIKNIFSTTNFGRMLKSMLPLGVIIYLAFVVAASKWPLIVHASMASVTALPGLIGGLAFEVAWKGAFILALWAVVDYLLQRRKFETDMKMSKQEVRDESKENEGNPASKGRMRKLQRQMRKQRMMKDVETATVVVTNPTHYAIALRYDMETMDVPVVVAKGRDLVAQKIRQIAQWNNVPLVENRPLAQALYRAADIGSAIPAKLYTAVAEILAFVYRAQAQAQAQARPQGAGGLA